MLTVFFENKLFGLLILTFVIEVVQPCTSFFCINSCGSNVNDKTSGYKLILANNRDENIYRPTWPANVWPPRNSNQTNKDKLGNKSLNELYCDQSKDRAPYNQCVYGALDTKKGSAPDYYSTWLGINEKGSLGNLLFFMKPNSHQKEKLRESNIDWKQRGEIVGKYIQNSNWSSVNEFMQELSDQKNLYKPFNYVQAVMSEKNGDYSLYYVNNNNSSETYEKLNKNNSMFTFGISNSDPQRPFQKVVKGEEVFNDIIKSYSTNLNKFWLVNSMINLLQNTTSNMPDETLANFMGLPDEKDEYIVAGVSKIKANYSDYWKNGCTRTSTLILVDYYNNVEYYEYNLTKKMDDTEIWKMNKFSFKLKV